MRMIDLELEREYDMKKVVIHLFFAVFAYTLGIFIYYRTEEISTLYFAPYLFVFAGYFVFDDYNDEIKKRNDLKINVIIKADKYVTKCHEIARRHI